MCVTGRSLKNTGNPWHPWHQIGLEKSGKYIRGASALLLEINEEKGKRFIVQPGNAFWTEDVIKQVEEKMNSAISEAVSAAPAR